MVKLGARVAGPSASKKLRKPYMIVDGGLPDYMSEEEDLYSKDTFQKADKYCLTTQFDWVYPRRVDLHNIEVCGYPISKNTFDIIDESRDRGKLGNLHAIEDYLEGELPQKEEDLLVDMVFTGDYLNPENRVTYGAWLTARQYYQSVCFIRRFFTDLGEILGESYLFMDFELKRVVSDLIDVYGNVNVITYKDDWNFLVELLIKAASDVTISRATNYQPYIAALEKGCNITTPVPAEGYMDEDTAGIQYSEKGLTILIEYNDEQYIFKFKKFIENRAEQRRIQENLRRDDFIKKRNLNQIIIDNYKYLNAKL